MCLLPRYTAVTLRASVSALLFYPVVFWYLVALFSSAGLLRTQAGKTATAIGAVVHAVDPAATTYFINRRLA